MRTTSKKFEVVREAYFDWLATQVREQRRSSRTYLDVLYQMYQKEFVWLVSNDDNRIVDGTDLRLEFLDGYRTRLDISRDDFGFCTVLEVMIGISRRLAFAAGGEAEGWAWQLLNNLRLQNATDPVSNRKVKLIEQILDNLVWRNYNPDGSGGFFPLNYPPEDQTKVEIWYQMAAYINEIRPDF